MDLLSLIKEKLTETVVEKISGFLGEHPEKIDSALNSAVPTVMGGIMQKANTPDETSKLLDILKDGGHTGEILNDLPNLLGHFDKTQMLITIGSNIANHFFGEKTNNIVETLSSVSGIRKTSSSSLLGLATPLVLGAIGKVVAKEGLGVSGLMKLLNEQKDSIQKALPPALFNQLEIKNTPIPVAISETGTNTEPVIKQQEAPKKSSSNAWIPWVLLLLLGLGALAWVKGYRNYFKNSKETDSLKVNMPVAVSTPHVDSTTITETHKLNPEKVATTTNTPPKQAETTVVSPSETKTIGKKSSTSLSEPLSASLNEKLDSNTDGWIGLGDVAFKKKSAELVKKGQIEELVKYLKNHAKAKIKVGGYRDGDKRLSEDRAYAVREELIENGVSESRIQIATDPISDNDLKVGVKIIKR